MPHAHALDFIMFSKGEVFTLANLISTPHYSLIILGSILTWLGNEIHSFEFEPHEKKDFLSQIYCEPLVLWRELRNSAFLRYLTPALFLPLSGVQERDCVSLQWVEPTKSLRAPVHTAQPEMENPLEGGVSQDKWTSLLWLEACTGLLSMAERLSSWSSLNYIGFEDPNSRCKRGVMLIWRLHGKAGGRIIGLSQVLSILEAVGQIAF